MNKEEIYRKIRNLGVESHYSGKTKTFYIDNCGKYYQCLLFSDIKLQGFNIVKN